MPRSRTFAVEKLPVRVFASEREMAADAAQGARDILSAAIASGGSAAAILATGNSQLQFLDALVQLGGVDWSNVTLFHMDEYLGLPATHSASFRLYMRQRVEGRLHPKAFNYIEGDALEPIAECDRYTQLLRAQPIDLCCLGIGENGHLAFNDPPVANFADPRWVKIVKLDRGCRMQQVGEGHFPNIDAVPQYALTLTLPALCSAAKMICICPEKRKAAAVKAALTGPLSTVCPASFLRQQAQCVLLLDTLSASEL